MYSKNRFFIFLLVLIFSAGSIFAQTTASANADVKIQLKRGLTITNLDGALDFGEVVLTGDPQTETITPDLGVKFEVTGHPSKSVTVTYADVTLNGSGTNTLAFSADLKHTLAEPTYTGEADVTSGNSYVLTPDGGVGRLYLWLGGSIDVAGATEDDYTGSFTVTVAY